MRVIQRVASGLPKICNLQPGDVIMVLDSATGAEVGPLIVMAAQAHQALSKRPNWGLVGPPPAAPPPAAPGGYEKSSTVEWKEGTDARLLDPTNGKVYTVHASSRCRPMRNAALVLNDEEVR